MWFRRIVVCSIWTVCLVACGTADPQTDTIAEAESGSSTVLPTTAVPTTTNTSTATLLPTNTATGTPTVSPTSTATPTPSPTVTATPTETLIPTATYTMVPPTATPIPSTATPLPSPTSSLPGNPLALTGGSYNGCPLLSPGQYMTDPFGCDSCVRMDLANWTMGQNLLQVSSAYEANGDIHIILSNGQDVNLNALNYLWLVEIHSVARAIETWEDSFSSIGLDQAQMYSVLGTGTTVGYLDFTETHGTKVLKVTAVCGE